MINVYINSISCNAKLNPVEELEADRLVKMFRDLVCLFQLYIQLCRFIKQK